MNKPRLSLAGTDVPGLSKTSPHTIEVEQEVQKRHELTFNPSLYHISEGCPLSEDIKVEQPMCPILCLP